MSVTMCRLQMMWNASNNSDKFCERIMETGLHADMLNNLSWAATANDGQSSGRRYFVNVHTNILHNVVRRIESAREAFRQCHAVDVMQKFRDVTKCPVIFVFSFIMQNAILDVAVWFHNAFGRVVIHNAR